jgi:hypothetical protein
MLVVVSAVVVVMTVIVVSIAVMIAVFFVVFDVAVMGCFAVILIACVNVGATAMISESTICCEA